MRKSLLSHIAGNFISEYENVANSSIAYLLNEYPASQTTLKQLIEVEEVPSYYVTELSTESNGRPDITGLDNDGNKVVIIEGKFWANLTENQPVNYLNELSGEGKLLFLAPEKRLSSLKLEIEKRLGGPNSRIIILSWNEFLDLIEKENNKDHNNFLASDLLQLKELCRKMDSEGLPPLSQSDLDPMNGRISFQLTSLLDECHSKLKQWEHCDFNKLQKTSSMYGYGFYFKAYEFTCRLYFSNHKWYIRDTKTPFWLVIQKSWKDSIQINNILNKRYKSSYENSVGIELQPGMDKEDAIEHIVKISKEILSFLNGKM
ncbi:hypothetical protein MNBD_GAMMA08-2505 [hydrothermal vent metagenome]|uniref:PD-(D/E)XK nuclease superfamily protein n=1 Tax=hydrothermal vent metagenome TaxID=652676 RepID=A0A3B0XLV4_9ZZZZ